MPVVYVRDGYGPGTHRPRALRARDPRAVRGSDLPRGQDLADAVILGVSVDDVESHKKFAAEHSLPFDILADSEKKVSGQYGVLFSAGPMQLASRQTFLIDPSGKIVKHWPKVDPKGHSDMVLAEIKAHSPAKAG